MQLRELVSLVLIQSTLVGRFTPFIAQRNHLTKFTPSQCLFSPYSGTSLCNGKHLASSWTQPGILPHFFFSMRFNHQGSLIPVYWFRFHLGHSYVSSVVTSRIRKGKNLEPTFGIISNYTGLYFRCQFGGP